MKIPGVYFELDPEFVLLDPWLWSLGDFNSLDSWLLVLFKLLVDMPFLPLETR
jgi:hypothetical protein